MNNSGQFKKGREVPADIAKKIGDKLRGRGIGRKCFRYKEWRKKVLERDAYKCTVCSSTENLQCHHKIPFEESIELRFEMNNGITLCLSCHRKEEIKINPGSLPNNKGRKITEETKEKMRMAKIGCIPHNKGKKGQKSWNKGTHMWNDEQRKQISLRNTGCNKGRKWFFDPILKKRVWYDNNNILKG